MQPANVASKAISQILTGLLIGRLTEPDYEGEEMELIKRKVGRVGRLPRLGAGERDITCYFFFRLMSQSMSEWMFRPRLVRL